MLVMAVLVSSKGCSNSTEQRSSNDTEAAQKHQQSEFEFTVKVNDTNVSSHELDELLRPIKTMLVSNRAKYEHMIDDSQRVQFNVSETESKLISIQIPGASKDPRHYAALAELSNEFGNVSNELFRITQSKEVAITFGVGTRE